MNAANEESKQLSLDTLSNIRRGVLRSDHELQVLKFLFNKYNCRTVSDEAKQSNITRQTVYNRIKSGDIASIELVNQTFIIY